MAVQTYQAKIEKIVQDTETVKTYFLNLGRDMDFIPGQFVMVEFAHKLPNTRRAYSISSSPSQKRVIGITLKKAGVFTTEMDNAPVGEEMLVKGPFGHFTLDESVKDDLIFLAGGTGVTPFRCMITYLLEKKAPNTMTLFYSSRAPDEFVFLDELAALQAKNPQFRAIFTATRCTDPSWKGQCERINPDMIMRTVPNYNDCLYYLCGPPEMVAAMQTMLEKMGIETKRIKAERWG
ncbi:hypothetical protein HY639_04460 [Candidatus Woesearchaeota archaeon]|nr:hypothetical protein [Candidatus Woesearchaeota archaeon]